MNHSYVVTGGGSGIGRVIAERLLADGGSVVVLCAAAGSAGRLASCPVNTGHLLHRPARGRCNRLAGVRW